jgi:hypothetical protein
MGFGNFAEVPNNTASSWYRDPGLRKGESQSGNDHRVKLAHPSGFLQIVILYTAVYSLGYDGSLLNGLQALPAWAEDFVRPFSFNVTRSLMVRTALLARGSASSQRHTTCA